MPKSFKHWGIKVRRFPEKNYHAVWNNLVTLRLGSGVAKQLDFPEFYDVALNSSCNFSCPFCYVSASNKGKCFDDICGKFERLINQMSENEKPFQIAIGSTGEPTIHPDFLKFIETVYNLNIVPNYTTNGLTLANDDEYSKELLAITEKYCGGVAVSCNNWSESVDKTWRKAVDKLTKIDVNINLHVIISDKNSVDRFIDIYNEYADKILYFVLLPLMPSGRSKEKYTQEAWDYLLDRMQTLDKSKISFGAHFYDSLKESSDKIKTWIYPPESMSANLILDTPVRQTPSSFDLETTVKEFNV